MRLDSRKSLGLEGIIAKDPNVCMPGTDYISPLREFGLEDVENRRSVR